MKARNNHVEKLKKIPVFCVCFVIGFMCTLPVYAYQTNVSGGFSGYPYSFRLHNTFTSAEGTSMSSATKAWESAGKGVLASKSSYSNAMTTYPTKDNYNNITRISTTSDYLAQCSWWTSNNKITEADININPTYSIKASPGSNDYDMQTIMTHEIGHSLGLGHSDDSGAVMKPSFGKAEKVRTINSDDIDGIKAIY